MDNANRASVYFDGTPTPPGSNITSSTIHRSAVCRSVIFGLFAGRESEVGTHEGAKRNVAPSKSFNSVEAETAKKRAAARYCGLRRLVCSGKYKNRVEPKTMRSGITQIAPLKENSPHLLVTQTGAVWSNEARIIVIEIWVGVLDCWATLQPFYTPLCPERIVKSFMGEFLDLPHITGANPKKIGEFSEQLLCAISISDLWRVAIRQLTCTWPWTFAFWPQNAIDSVLHFEEISATGHPVWLRVRAYVLSGALR